jgi:hypothetical protein
MKTVDAVKEFDWDSYEKSGNTLVQNERVNGQDNKTIVYSHERYAQELFDLMDGNNMEVVKKDLKKGDVVLITDIRHVNGGTMNVELFGGMTMDIDLNREKKFVSLFGYETAEDFCKDLVTEDTRQNFLNQGIGVLITENQPSVKVSLLGGYLEKIKIDFLKEIDSPSTAYVAKITDANRGGYTVEVQGLKAFMPGSLAAPNKIVDFHSMVGKEVIVMVEGYVPEMNSFIVSHKKYIEHILPNKIQELDKFKRYKGTVTGTSKYGIFIEFEDIFTGLLHVSKMSEETAKLFRERHYKPTMDIEFFIEEITKENRIILTEEDPKEKRRIMDEFYERYKDKKITSTIKAIMGFGVICEVENITGLIPNKEFKNTGVRPRDLEEGSFMEVSIKEYNDNKFIFNIAT